MKYFISESGEVFAYESDGSQDAFIKDGLIPLSDEELAAIRAKAEQDNQPTPEQLLQIAGSKRDELLALAGLRISPLQDAVDLDEATADEVANLKLWKGYRIDVNRVSKQSGYPTSIQWPVEPA